MFCAQDFVFFEGARSVKKLVFLSLTVFTAICLMVATEQRAWGYVDPGSGLLVLQSLASMMAACGFFFRRRIKNLFARKAAAPQVVTQVVVKENNPAKVA